MRVRVCLSAGHTDAQINSIVRSIIDAAQEIGVIPKRPIKPEVFETPTTGSHADGETVEARFSSESIGNIIERDAAMPSPTIAELSLIQAGHEARRKFGLASGRARWISGTFSVHVEVEKLVEGIVKMPAALTYADSYIGLLSSVSALCRPLLGRREHSFLLFGGCV